MKPNQKKRKLQPSYFNGLKQQYGEMDPVSKLPNGQLARDVWKIFRDLGRGAVDVFHDGYFFLNLEVLRTCQAEAKNQININSYYYNAFAFYIANCPGGNTEQYINLMNLHLNKVRAYELVLYYLNQIEYTRDVNWLHALMNNLRAFRGVF